MRWARPRMVLKRNRAFRRLFLGMLASRIGDAFFVVAASWLVLDIAGPAQLGVVLLLGGLPAVVVSPVVGHLLDRWGLRLPLVLDNVVRALLLLVVAALASSGRITLWQLYIVAVVLGLTAMTTEIGQSMAVPEVVPDEDLDDANTLVSVIWDVAALAGPVLAGLVVQAAGPATAFAVDAGTFLVMAVVSLSLPGRRRDPGGSTSDRRRLRSGFSALTTLPGVSSLLVLSFGVLLLGGALEILLPTYSREVLASSAVTYGVLASLMGAASLVGTVLLTPLLSDLPARRALSILLVGKAVVLAPLAVLGSPVVTGVALACAGLLDGPFYPISRSLIHRRVPADLRGRVFGAMGAVTGSAFPVGSALTGVALGATGAAWTVVLIAAAHLPLVAVAAATRSFRGPSAATAPGQEQDLGKGHPVGSNTSAS